MSKVVRPNQYDPQADDGAGYQYTYDYQGHVLTVVGPNGHVLQTNTYDGEGRPLQQLDGLQSGAEFSYDLGGNRTHIKTSGGAAQELEYDARGNIVGVVDGNQNRTTYRLDAWGRITGIIKADGSTEYYAYDLAGNMTASTDGEGHTTQYQYNRAGQLSAIVDPTGEKETYQYDGEGLRYEMEENGNLVQFIFNLDREAVTERDASGITRLIRGTELIARNTDTVRTYYHYASDEMGSTTHIVDDEGQVQNRYTYDAWGKIEVKEEAVPNRFKFTGQQLDPVTQQYYLRARFYNPVIARFTQEDTYRGDGLNLYAYCANNPVYYVDPSGLAKNPYVSSSQEVNEILTRTTAGLDGATVGKVPRKASTFDSWFDALTIDELKVLMTDTKVRTNITSMLRGDGYKHEFLMVSNAVIAKSWGLTAKDIKTMTTGTENTYFLNVTASNGDIVSGFHTGTRASTAAHMGPDGISQLMKQSSSFEEFKMKLNIWAEEHLVAVYRTGFVRGHKALPIGLIAGEEELAHYREMVARGDGLNVSPRAIYNSK